MNTCEHTNPSCQIHITQHRGLSIQQQEDCSHQIRTKGQCLPTAISEASVIKAQRLKSKLLIGQFWAIAAILESVTFGV